MRTSLRRLIIALEFFVAVSAFAGAVVLFVWRHGGGIFPLSMLKWSPFETFTAPAALLGAVGAVSLVCGVLVNVLLEYYRRHADQFTVPAKARFEILTLYYQNFPSRQAAEQTLAEMGNAVYLGGASFASAIEPGRNPSPSEKDTS